MKKIISTFLFLFLFTGLVLSKNNNGESWKRRKFTTIELKKYDGKKGMPVYVAVDGIVYDLTNNKYWKTDLHMNRHNS